jgi:SSS family solute:Na+ symporter
VPKVTSWIIASVLGACTAQAGIQPLLAARDVRVAKRSAIITACIVAPFGIFTALIGMAAKVKFPTLAPNLAMPTLLMRMDPVAGGIVLASILAAILSTISPIILAAGTMVTKDIYQRVLRPDATDRQLFRFSRLATAAAGVCTIAIAMLPDVRILDLVYFAYTLRGSIFVIILFGIYWRATSPTGAVWSMLATAGVGLFWVAWKGWTGSFPIHEAMTETYAAVIAALVLTPILSHAFPKEPKSAAAR